MSYCVIDLETTTKESFGRVSNPFDKENWIVALGYKYNDGDVYTNYASCPINSNMMFYAWSPNCNQLVGFNIKFDLLYLWSYTTLQVWLENGGKVWDCQLVEYILSGQTHKYPSLDQCAAKYGGTLKDDRIKALWKSGCQTQDIPKDMLLEYLKHDVENTELVYLKQLEQVKKLKLENFIELQMDALLATTEMEYNGMYVDQVKAARNKSILNLKLQEKEKEIQAIIASSVVELKDIPINIGSNNHMSAVFFGGEIKIQERKQIGVYKSGEKIGQPRYKRVDVSITCPGFTKPHKNWASSKPGVYSVNESVLTQLAKRYKQNTAGLFAAQLLDYRGLAKELNTYYESMVKLVQPDGTIHHSLNHCATVTGRLSSTKPNMQNIPKTSNSEYNVKEIFVSRWEGGQIIELDFKSLEVVAAAFLSQDPVMIADIVQGKDPHTENAAIVFDKSIDAVTESERQIAKVASFELLYGAGANKIAEVQFDRDKERAMRFINAYYGRYSRLKRWQCEVAENVKANARLSDNKTQLGLPSKSSTLRSCTGRLYKFLEYDAPKFLCDKGIFTSFSPTEMKNYPVQGFATADIVLFQLGKLFRVLMKHRDKCLLINTVHDEALIDCRPEFLTIVQNTAKLKLEDVNSSLGSLSINFNVPIAVTVKSGISWGDV